MSLRAIKKRDNPQTSNIAGRRALFKKASTTTTTQQRKTLQLHTQSQNSSSNNTKVNKNKYSNFNKEIHNLHVIRNLQQQYTLLDRAVYSNPELRQPLHAAAVDTVESLAHLVRTKSDGDVNALLKSCKSNAADTTGRSSFLGAKSEVCLQTISSHSYREGSQTTDISATSASTHNKNEEAFSAHSANAAPITAASNSNMLSGARSHRDLTQSTYNASSSNNHNNTMMGYDVTVSPSRRRLSECSFGSSTGLSQRTTSALSSSALTLSSNNPATNEPNAVMRVPIIGYEVMEERARFTVYKLRVENPMTNDCWLVLRRYTDFVRLNTKLKQLFANVVLHLPRKKIFGDNFNAVFLDNRVQGLQIFVNSIMAKEELRKCKLVREFFCLDEPPSYSESMEECRAIFEAQEETIAHLKVQVNNKNELILSLQQKLREEIAEKEQMKKALEAATSNCPRCGIPNRKVEP